MNIKETITIILASLILAITVSFSNHDIIYKAFLSFLIIITVNLIAKKIVGYNFETEVKTKLWTMQQYGLRKDFHFKSPIPMIWLPVVLAIITKGFFWWLGVLEFDVKAKPERATKRHGLYRFTELTEWHIGLIAVWGLIANLTVAVAAYILGFELFTKLSAYYIFWSVLPIGRLDGSKIFFSRKALWFPVFIIALVILAWGLII
jgi:hypothetical protein